MEQVVVQDVNNLTRLSQAQVGRQLGDVQAEDEGQPTVQGQAIRASTTGPAFLERRQAPPLQTAGVAEAEDQPDARAPTSDHSGKQPLPLRRHLHGSTESES